MSANGIQLYRNPDYARQYPNWKRYSDLYYGDYRTMRGADYLWYHKIESLNDADSRRLRASREQRTRYLNLPEINVSLWQSLLFRDEPILDAEALKNLDGAEHDIDGNGNSFTTWLRDYACRDYLVFGNVIALTDAFPFVAASKKQEQTLGLRPFVELLSPLNVVDWGIEAGDPKRVGKYNFLRHEYDVTLPRTRSREAPRVRRQSAELMLDGGVYTLQMYSGPTYEADKSGSLKPLSIDASSPWSLDGAPVATKLKELPLTVINSVTWIDGVCEETLRHYNIRSNKDNILYNQGFDQIFIKGISANDMPAFNAAMNEYTKIFLPENGDAFKLDATEVAAYERAEAQALDAVFKVGLNQLHSLPGDSKIIAAADSQNAQKDNTYATIEASIEQLETFANDILVRFEEFKTGGKRPPGKIDFCDNVSDQNITDFMTVWAGFRDMFRGIEEIEKPAAKIAVEKLGFNEKELKLAQEAIDRASFGQANQQQIAGRRADAVATALNGGQANG